MKYVLIGIGVFCLASAIMLYACCVMAGREDKRMEKYRRNRDEVTGEGKDA